MEPTNQPPERRPGLSTSFDLSAELCMAPSQLISSRLLFALTEPSRFYERPEDAVEGSGSYPDRLPLARASLVGFALQSADYQREGWYSLFELDPRGAGITAAAFALLGKSPQSTLAYEALGHSDPSLAAACASVIIAKGDYRLVERALAVLEAYDLGSAQHYAGRIDARGLAHIHETKQRILRQPAAECRLLPTIPLEVYTLKSVLLDSTLDRTHIQGALCDPRAASTPILASILHHMQRDPDQRTGGESSPLASWGREALKDFLSLNPVQQLLSSQRGTTPDFFLSRVMASALWHQLRAELAPELKRIAEVVGATPALTSMPGVSEPVAPLGAFRPPLHMAPGCGGRNQSPADQIQLETRVELRHYMQKAISQMEQYINSKGAAQSSHPVLHLLLAQELADRGRNDLSREQVERALTLCG